MKRILVPIALFLILFESAAQQVEIQPIVTGVPFLTITADARASGMGDVGVATSVDAFSQQWNPAKFAFAENKMGFSLSYAPYLESLVNDIGLLNANFYTKIDDRSAFATSIRYFTLGEIELRQTAGEDARIVKPNEFSLDGSYSLKLSETFSMAVLGRFISSNLRFPDQTGSGDAQAANTFAVDLAAFYRSREIAYDNFSGRWRAGVNISNLGNKITYDQGGAENFLPTNLKAGVGFDFIFDMDNTLAITTEFNKLLVPTPQDFNEDGVINSSDNNEYQNIGFLSGVFQSFGDAPGGFSEELQEITWALGVEYKYQDAFMLRTGYFNESDLKGARKFFSLGAGFKFEAIEVDMSYLFSTSRIPNPLENSLRISLTFNFGDEMFND